MRALVEYTKEPTFGALIPIKPISSAQEARERHINARQRINAAGAAQRAKEDQKAAEEALKRKKNQEAWERHWLLKGQLYWQGRGRVMYNRPIGPQQRTVTAEHENKSAHEILDCVAQRHNLKPSDVTGYSRERRYIPARRELCYELMVVKNWSLSQIGRYLDRDHTSVLHAIKCHVEFTGAVRPPRLKPWKHGKLVRKTR